MEKVHDLRIEKGKQTRQNILRAAFTVMVEDGPNYLTAGKIAKRAGVSKASLFHYFATVDDVAFAVLEDLFDQFSGAMTVARHKSVADFVYSMGIGPVEALKTKRKVMAAFLHFYQRAAHDETFRSLQEKTTRLFIKHIAQGIESTLNRKLSKAERQAIPTLVAMSFEGLGQFCIIFEDRRDLKAAWKAFANSIGNFFEKG